MRYEPRLGYCEQCRRHNVQVAQVAAVARAIVILLCRDCLREAAMECEWNEHVAQPNPQEL